MDNDAIYELFFQELADKYGPKDALEIYFKYTRRRIEMIEKKALRRLYRMANGLEPTNIKNIKNIKKIVYEDDTYQKEDTDDIKQPVDD
jgi:hypothetical protein